MRLMDQNTLNALVGSRSGDRITAFVWYNGQLAYPDPLPVDGWSADWDTTRQVQQLQLSISDKDGRLAPWLLEDPLGVGGALLQVTYQVGGAGTVNLGWYRIAQSAPVEHWHSYTIDDVGNVHPTLGESYGHLYPDAPSTAAVYPATTLYPSTTTTPGSGRYSPGVYPGPITPL